MKTKQFTVFLTFAFCIIAIAGCTNQAWYEGAKQGAENNCRSQPPGESERCLEKLNKKTYEEYEKERSEQK
ncbi:hypothetical protein [Methylotenera sp.]|uniref:hypothetical protein n=1 Tax=Methylotenera sp. TaxID=2051956 RepID=UPI00248A1DD5|nr:hypothetical protein [Methylotenera sp.]MDI1299698.1 hypothetical protein [Methylotenera sp.]